MKCIKPSFYGRFTKFSPFNDDEYEAKKDIGEQEMQKTEEGATKMQTRRKEWLLGTIRALKKLNGLSNRDIADIISNSCNETISEMQVKRFLALP